jgi:tetratricopeptide (TPR) repeat protein
MEYNRALVRDFTAACGASTRSQFDGVEMENMSRVSSSSSRAALACSFLFLVAVFGMAQSGAPSSIQIFMPGGSLPDRSMRFELTRDDGRIETLFTDTKGKFLITGDLVRDADYIIKVEGDGRSFASTTVAFRTFRNIVIYVPVFLNPLEGKKKSPAAVLNVLEVNVPDEARKAYQQAMDEAGKGENERAINDLRRALTIYPQYLRALNDLGVLYIKTNRLEEAEKTFRQAIKINQAFVYPRLNLGIVLNRQAKYSEAVDLLGKLYQESSLLTARLPYAEALAETGRLSEAENLFQAICEDENVVAATRAEAHFRLGALLNKQNRFADAVTQFEAAIRLQENMVMAHLQLGGALIQLKRLSEAEHELLKAYQLGGASAGAAQFLLGEVYHLQGKYELAIRSFEQFLADVPNAPNATQVRDAIEKMKTALKDKP